MMTNFSAMSLEFYALAPKYHLSRIIPRTMFLQEAQSNPRFFLAVCITVILSITIHELAHGIVAVWRGDDTPIETGHMTLNPAVHMGVISIVCLLLAGISWGSMPVDPSRL